MPRSPTKVFKTFHLELQSRAAPPAVGVEPGVSLAGRSRADASRAAQGKGRRAAEAPAAPRRLRRGAAAACGAGSGGCWQHRRSRLPLLSYSKSLPSEPRALGEWDGLGKLLGWEGGGCYTPPPVLPGSAAHEPLARSVPLQLAASNFSCRGQARAEGQDEGAASHCHLEG